MKQHPLYGYLCAACGRCLEELSSWQLGKERFYCGVICKETDELAHATPTRTRTEASGSSRK